jgi:heme/copper-type cytochrome/quinol oxidase subunit 2
MIARTWLRSISVDLLWTHPIIIIILVIIIIVVVIIVVVVIIFIIFLIACLEKKLRHSFTFNQKKD